METASLLAILALGARFPMDRLRHALRSAISARLAPLLGAAVVILYWMRNATLVHLMDRVPGSPSYLATLPLRLYFLDRHTRASLMNADLLFALAEVVVLAALAAVASRLSARAFATVGFGTGGALLLVALFCPWLASEDVYLYVGQALLGRAAYAPPSIAFTGDLAPIGRIWGVPLLPSAYGPLFLAMAHAAIALAPTLTTKLMMLRGLGVGSFLACVLLVRVLAAPRAVVIAVAANPGLVDLYVTNAHNDLLAIDFVLAGLVLARRGSMPLALALATLAVLVKLTLLVPGLLVCAVAATRLRRLVTAAFYVTVACASYLALAGPAALGALSTASRAYPYAFTTSEIALRACVAAATLLVALSALWSARVYARGAWSFAGLAQYMLPWYVPWGLPCALADPGVALAFLLTLPLAIVVCDSHLVPTPFYEVWAGGTILMLLIGVARGYFLARRAASVRA